MQVQIIASSALSSFDFVLDRAVTDLYKVGAIAHHLYTQATSEDAVSLYRSVWSITAHPWQRRELSPSLQTYQFVVRLVALFGLLAIACGASAREWCDRLVTWAEECPSPAVEVTEVERVEEQAIAPVEPVAVAEIEEVATVPDPVAQIPATVAQPQKRKRGRPRKQLATA